MSEFKNLLLIVILIAFIYYRYKMRVRAASFNKMLAHNIKIKLGESDYFSDCQFIYGDIDRGEFAAMAVDNISQKTGVIHLIDRQNPGTLELKVYDPSQIVAVDLLEDKVAVMSTNRMSQAGGFIVGDVLLGGAGAVIGSLTGKKTTNEIVSSIDLKIVVENLKKPIILHNFFTGKVKRNTEEYKRIIKHPQHWHAKLSTLIHIAKK